MYFHLGMATPRILTTFAIIAMVKILSLVHGSEQKLDLSLLVTSKPPHYQGQVLTYQSYVKHLLGFTNKTAENVTIVWLLPSFISYKNHHASAKLPNAVTFNANQITMKFGFLTPLEKINLLINVTVDVGHTLRDNRFHHATISATLKYRWSDVCSSERSSVKVLHFPFFCPECGSFGTLGIQSGDIKASQVKGSTFTIYPHDTNAWVPMTTFLHLGVKRRMKLNFYQVDLKYSRNLLMVTIDGIPKDDPIPYNIVKLSFSENSWKWKIENIYTIEVFPSNVDTAMVAIAILKQIKTRYLRISIPPFGVSDSGAKVYKVELYACDSNIVITEEDPSPVGIESSSLVPDSRFSSPSILGPQYQPHFGRLNTKVGGGSWCASGCSPLQYLQIHLGDTWRISEIKHQGRFTTNGAVFAVKTYSFSSSLNGVSWTPYNIDGNTKIFFGNQVSNLATRHKLSKPIQAKFVRFEPKTCIQKACMRVELYGTRAKFSEITNFPVVFGRSMLLNKATATLFACNSEVKKDLPHCYFTKNHGNLWQAISPQVLNILAFDPNEQKLYGLSRNGRTYLKSKNPEGSQWYGIPQQDWLSVRDGGSVYTAVEIPFVPISRNETNVIEPLVQLTAFNGDKWQADEIGVYFKPNGGTVRMVLSFLPYSDDLSPNPCHTGVCVFGRCEFLEDSMRYNCHCMPGYTGAFCDTVIDYCVSSPCQHNGTCTPFVNGFKCTCAANYYRSLCEEFDECSSSPCLHGGTCTDGPSSYTCACPTGYSGMSCEVTPCSTNPCLNGGTCELVRSGYKCKCKVSYAGTICQYDPFIIRRGPFAPSSDPWDYSSGKFDKIIFKVNQTMQLLGICLPDTFSASSTSELTLKSKNIDGSSTSSSFTYSNNFASGFTGNKLRCTSSGFTLRPNIRYLIEVLLKGPRDFRKVINGIGSGTHSLPDGSRTVLYTFQSVNAAALDDSNGATHTTGGIHGLKLQFRN